MVVRLDGTNEEEGRKLLRDANPPNLTSRRRCSAPRGATVELAGEAA